MQILGKKNSRIFG